MIITIIYYDINDMREKKKERETHTERERERERERESKVCSKVTKSVCKP